MVSDVKDLSTLSDGALIYLTESHQKAFKRNSDLEQEYKYKAGDSLEKFEAYKHEMVNRGLKLADG